MEVKLESDWSRGLVSKQISLALVVVIGFRTRPLWNVDEPAVKSRDTLSSIWLVKEEYKQFAKGTL